MVCFGKGDALVADRYRKFKLLKSMIPIALIVIYDMGDGVNMERLRILFLIVLPCVKS